MPFSIDEVAVPQTVKNLRRLADALDELQERGVYGGNFRWNFFIVYRKRFFRDSYTGCALGLAQHMGMLDATRRRPALLFGASEVFGLSAGAVKLVFFDTVLYDTGKLGFFRVRPQQVAALLRRVANHQRRVLA